VCLHHDAGALGAVWNEDAWVRRLLKLKEMGCNAIRTSHNPPATELLDLCDRMGFLVLDELTDTWTWPGREGKVTPVHVYTSGDEAELFLNGKSLGRKQKDGYRIVWDNVLYAPGTLEVVCYKNGREWARDKVQTAGKAAKLSAYTDYEGKDLCFVAVDVLDKAGVLCPGASATIEFKVNGPAEIVATDAGDPTSHVPFYSHELPAFAGKASVIVRRTGNGPITVSASSKGLKKAKITL